MGGYGSSYSYDSNASVTRKSAKAYNIDAGRKYTERKAALPPPVGKVLITDAKFPLVVAVDVTGSMREFPGIIFEKLCILYNEVLHFLPTKYKETFEISFAAIGDAYTDVAPLQITDFAKGLELDSNIESIYPEGGGGGQSRETYELIAYYYLKHCEMPKNTREDPKPLMIFVGDEGFYSKINRQHVYDLIGDDKQTDLISKDVFKELAKKFNVYILRIKYHGEDQHIHESWKAVLGPEKVILMEDPRRIVDTILGIIAAHVDSFEVFQERIAIRQTPEQVDQVYQSLSGVKEGEKKYIRFDKPIEALICQQCGGKLPESPDFNKPIKCKKCGTLIIRI